MLLESSNGSLTDADRTLDRVAALDATPTLAAALEAGTITAGHVDAVTRCSKLLDGDRRSELVERVDRLGSVAAAATVAEFRRRVRDEARRVERDDGTARLERQHRNTRLASWVDGEGM